MKQSLLALSACLALPASAAWHLDEDASRLHFMSTKNAQVTEIHSFKALSGELSDEGKLTVKVPLSSVDTAIDIRDTRLEEKVFEVAKFAEATFTADVPQDMLSLKAGDTIQGSVEGTMDLHGVKAPVTFDVIASKVNDNEMVVTTVTPTLISAESFKLKEGLETLQAIASLNSITFTVPVTFSVTFTQ
ncbi:YceI family protein [Alteromonas pelagimontana]|uniref:YceI family protein n=2 Tax=Alteromonas pelagimontana TaxID=1858656 RepID=A0A6M4MHX7_9ALTE|nr:YceI family protein [Alteromonas pelagimontana]